MDFANCLKEHIWAQAGTMTREPTGILRHPYLVPALHGAQFYSSDLWDWDSWLTSVALAQVETDLNMPGRFAPYAQGCIHNFLDQCESGTIPIKLEPRGAFTHHRPGRAPALPQNMHKPVLAQHAAFLSAHYGDVSWIADRLDEIACFLERYMTTHRHLGTGLAYWQTDFAVGVDNDPAVFYRPDKSCGSIYLNSLLYRELLALGQLLDLAGRSHEADNWRERAASLQVAIHDHCWDPRDQTYYSVDLALRERDPEDWLHRGAPRSWDSLLLRIDGWSSFMPLWAGLATPEQAEFLADHLDERRTFRAKYGIRTLSPLEKQYSLSPTNNPSNWLGPVWGVSNYLVWRGLAMYGYAQQAEHLANDTIMLFGRDLGDHGCLHEYYHPDTGQPLMTPGFQNWNFLALVMIAALEGRNAVCEIPSPPHPASS